ncbi:MULTISPECIES: helix-turn-helix transcriptional regulator [Streptomyces]|uniref:helix-turn-helix transcriptional regulator n=1 Tax=Streptomyces TaxID=1883 RepID=UPI000F79CF78|nr:MULTISPECIES: transcriptional regulator [Streptomyces]RST06904.1 transcriptional regulator [Streptomyces sp. WAC07149]GLX17083.1 DNA-binding transcriptional regulator [Streptomyces lavendulae subsp. lavendulae]GLX29590.1 DNA-binding transcriptional regulator [Streptomyces lavendulae subsp. lavendulae]
MSQDLPARMLRLLSLLQTRRTWSGAELAERLGVTLRTIRRDIERLRDLGYPVDATTGVAGGYRLAAGTDLPPLLLDDEEAVAIAVALRTATSGVTGIQETAARALAKLEQVLPQRLRHQVAALQAAASPLPVPWSRGPEADPAVLATLAAACRDHETLTFTYRSGSGESGPRRAEPYALVAAAPVWYLVAYDTGHDEWRLFRVDRLTDPAPTGRRTPPRALPAADAASYVAARLAAAPARYAFHATVPADARTVRARAHALPDRVRPLDDHTSTLDLAADDPHHIAQQLLGLDLGAEDSVEGTPELAPHLERYGRRLLRAARAIAAQDAHDQEPGTADRS